MEEVGIEKMKYVVGDGCEEMVGNGKSGKCFRLIINIHE
jgi:hypothetical protein